MNNQDFAELAERVTKELSGKTITREIWDGRTCQKFTLSPNFTSDFLLSFVTVQRDYSKDEC